MGIPTTLGNFFKPSYASVDEVSYNSFNSYLDALDRQLGVNVIAPPYNADRTGVVDSTAAIQAAVDSISTGEIHIPYGTYLTSDTITVSNHRVSILGQGPKATIINFVPSSDGKSAFKWQLGSASYIAQNAIKNLSISSTDTTTYQKTGLHFVDVSGFQLNNVCINQLIGNSSVGILIQGRDLTSLDDLEIWADIPIQVSKNPNTATSDMTAFSLHDTYFMATGTNPHMLIDTNCWVVGLTIDGTNVWAFGKYGIYMADADTTSAMYNWSINNLILEQISQSGGYCFYLSPNSALHNVTFNNVYAGPSGQINAHGWYMRNCRNVVLDSCTYDAVGTPINADNTAYPLELRNVYINPAANALSTGTLIPYKYITSSAGMVNHALYMDSASSNIGTLTANAGTVSVGLYDTWQTANTNPTTYVAFTNAYPGKKVRILIQDANTTVDFTGTNLKGNGGADWSPANGDWMEGVTLDGTTWYFSVHDCT